MLCGERENMEQAYFTIPQNGDFQALYKSIQENEAPDGILSIQNNSVHENNRRNMARHTLSFLHAFHIAVDLDTSLNSEAKEALKTQAGSAVETALSTIKDAPGLPQGKADVQQLHQHFETAVGKLTEQLSQATNCSVKKAFKKLTEAEKLANLSRPRPKVKAKTTHKKTNIKLKETANTTLTDLQKQELQKIGQKDKPAWFKALKPITQDWLSQHVNELIEGTINCPPATLRSIPGLANYATHTGKASHDGASITLSYERHATFTPIDIKDANTRSNLAEQNAVQLLTQSKPKARFAAFWGDLANDMQQADVTALLQEQCLLSPNGIEDKFSGQNSNGRMAKSSAAALETAGATYNAEQGLTNEDKQAVKVQQSNWALNNQRTTANSFEHATTKDSLQNNLERVPKALKTLANKTVDIRLSNALNQLGTRQCSAKEIWKDTKLLNELCKLFNEEEPNSAATTSNVRLFLAAVDAHHALKDLLKNPALNTLEHNNQMIASSLEAILVQGTGGVSSVACKSGKDRTSHKIIHDEATATFFVKEGKLPDHNNDEDRADFCAIYAAIYNMRVHQHVTSQNSFGVEGLKDDNSMRINRWVGKIKSAVGSLTGKDMGQAFGMPPDISKTLSEGSYSADVQSAKGNKERDLKFLRLKARLVRGIQGIVRGIQGIVKSLFSWGNSNQATSGQTENSPLLKVKTDTNAISSMQVSAGNSTKHCASLPSLSKSTSSNASQAIQPENVAAATPTP